MRNLLLVAATWALALGVASPALAGGGCADTLSGGGDAWGDPCGNRCGCRLFGHHGGHGNRIDGLDRSFNCGCGGSYNYPVPPLYTYHWPGMYKQRLMTDYRSPWRFPPLKPYVDEVPLPMAEVIESADGLLVPVSLERGWEPASIPSDRIETISSRLERGR
jgi:hypothetical protein